MANPFFSGRIPQSLHNKVEEYCKETGKGKTEILVEALSKYLDFPIEKPVVKNEYVTLEMFENLLGEIASINLTINNLQNSVNYVISRDNKRNHRENRKTKQTSDSAIEEQQVNTLPLQNNVLPKDFSNKNDATIIDNNVISSDKEIVSLEQTADYVQELTEPLMRKSISSKNLSEIPNITSGDKINLRNQAFTKAQKNGYEIIEDINFNAPIEMTYKKGIIIENYEYKLFCKGIDKDKKPIWTLEPTDNNSYHHENKEINLDNKQIVNTELKEENKKENNNVEADNNSYHKDNNAVIFIPFNDK